MRNNTNKNHISHFMVSYNAKNSLNNIFKNIIIVLFLIKYFLLPTGVYFRGVKG
jgi:hypothetical protein